MTTQDYDWESSSEDSNSYQSDAKNRLLQRLASTKNSIRRNIHCSNCDETYFTQADYENHISLSEIECPGCGDLFNDQCEYTTHECRFSESESEEEYLCKVCGQYTTLEHCPNCVVGFDLEHVKESTCKICGKDYLEKTDSHHRCVAYTPVECQDCGQFTVSDHECLPTYNCPICGEVYPTEEIMKQHIDQEHAMDLESEDSDESNIDHSTAKMCVICNDYISDADMWYHMTIEHDGDYPPPVPTAKMPGYIRSLFLDNTYQEVLPEPEDSFDDDSFEEPISRADELRAMREYQKSKQVPPRVYMEESTYEDDLSDDTYISDDESEYEIHTPPDTRGHLLLEDLSKLKTTLKKAGDSSNLLLVEREGLIAQLQMCEERMQKIEDDRIKLERELLLKEQEKQKHIQELDAKCANNKRLAAEESICSELLVEMTDFPQAVQVLLHANKYYDYDDLIRSHIRNLDVFVTSEVRNSIILEAKLQKKKELELLIELDEDSFLIPKTSDGLPNLYDSVITDSYTIVNQYD